MCKGYGTATSSHQNPFRKVSGSLKSEPCGRSPWHHTVSGLLYRWRQSFEASSHPLLPQQPQALPWLPWPAVQRTASAGSSGSIQEQPLAKPDMALQSPAAQPWVLIQSQGWSLGVRGRTGTVTISLLQSFLAFQFPSW